MKRYYSAMKSHTLLHKQENSSTVKACLFASVIVIAYALLIRESEIRLAIPQLIAATAVITVALAGTLYCGTTVKSPWSPPVVLAIALLLRLIFLFNPPQLSDDIYRYLWDGSTLVSGINPYATAPAAVAPPPGLTAIHTQINHPQYVTIYPPAAQILFAGGALFGKTITGLKAFLVLLDLGLCALLMLLLKRLELPTWSAILYAWNPLPVLEIAGSGHVDGAGFTLLIGSLCLLILNRQGTVPSQWRYLLSGALAACAGLVKLFPFALVPLLFLLVPAGRRKGFVSGFFVALAALVLPFLPQLANMLSSLNVYARNWEFAGFLFTTLRSLTGSGAVARLLVSTCFLLACGGIFLRCAANFHNEEPIIRARRLLAACYATAMAFLLLTPTLQPWYALSLATFLPFCAGPAGLVLCWAIFLTYQVQIPYFILGAWLENPYVTAAVFLAPVIAFLMSRYFRLRWGAEGC